MVAANKARDDAKTLNEEALKFKAYYDAEVGQRRDEADELTKQLSNCFS